MLNKYIKYNFVGQRCGTSNIVDIRRLTVGAIQSQTNRKCVKPKLRRRKLRSCVNLQRELRQTGVKQRTSKRINHSEIFTPKWRCPPGGKHANEKLQLITSTGTSYCGEIYKKISKTFVWRGSYAVEFGACWLCTYLCMNHYYSFTFRSCK